MTSEQLILKWVLAASGSFLIIAFAAMLLSVDSMAAAHHWLGFGEYPDFPITNYLARSTSLLYGVHGVITLYTAITIDKHWRFAWLLGMLHVVIGCAMFLIDWFAPMPLYWLLAEGPGVAALGVVILWLAGRGKFRQCRD